MELDINFIKKEFADISKDEFIKSFNEFRNITKDDDILLIIIRGHLYIEHELDNLLSKYINEPRKLNHKYYKQKLDTVNALGIINQELFECLKFLNDLRNKFVHDLKFNFSDDEYNKLHSKLSRDKQIIVDKSLDEESDLPEKVRIVLSMLWGDLKITTLNIFYRTQYSNKLQQGILDEVNSYIQRYTDKNEDDI